MTPLVLTVVGVVLSAISTAALSFGAWYFRKLDVTLGDLARQVSELRVVIAKLETRDESQNQELKDLRERVRALEAKR